MKKIFIFIAIAVIIVIAFLVYKSKNVLSNFEAVQKNLNMTLVNGIAVLSINGKKLQCYSNGRFFIFNSSNQVLVKGNYYNGGKEVKSDSGDYTNSNNILENFSNVK